MHFRLPKPLHGWREFAGEVQIIVVGVLIALGAGQVVEMIHNRSVAAATRAGLRAEFEDDLASMARRRNAESCVERRLDELRSLLAVWAKTGRFQTPQWVANPPISSIRLTRYNLAVSGAALGLLPSEEQYRIGNLASEFQFFAETQHEERQAWGELRELQGGPEVLSTVDRGQIRTALQNASTLDYDARSAVEKGLPLAASYGYRPNFSNLKSSMAVEVRTRNAPEPICLPIDTPRQEAQNRLATPLPL